MEQHAAIGMEEGLTLAVGQIDAFLAEDARPGFPHEWRTAGRDPRMSGAHRKLIAELFVSLDGHAFSAKAGPNLDFVRHSIAYHPAGEPHPGDEWITRRRCN
jgi:hypothetical protein